MIHLGAYPGIEAEERGQGEAIARNLFEMSKLKVPTISVVIGEGSSGGALAIGVTDIIIMLENSIYSILSPEGFASILYKDSSKAKEAADKMKITAHELKDLNIVDDVIFEPENGANVNFENVCTNLKSSLIENLSNLLKLDSQVLINNRYEKFRKIGNI